MAANADEIADSILSAYGLIGSRGKPSGDEWTVLAGIVAERAQSLQVISLATGNKCVGKSGLSLSGDVVNDSHAEVLSRRAFLKFLYAEIHHADGGATHPGSLLHFDAQSRRYALRRDVSLHLYISTTPCGDASICGGKGKEDDLRRVTGAKAVSSNILGAIRTKSGRSDILAANRTLSMSCSDKIVRWCNVGMQGSLLSRLLAPEPLRLSSLTVGAGALFDHGRKEPLCATEVITSIERAIVDRSPLPACKCSLTKRRYSHDRPFESRDDSTQAGRKRKRGPPVCGYALNATWVPAYRRANGASSFDVEVLISARGKKQGATKKGKGSQSAKSRSRLCKLSLFQDFIKASKVLGGDEQSVLRSSKYGELKRGANAYQASKAKFEATPPFSAWVKMPRHYDDFGLVE